MKLFRRPVALASLGAGVLLFGLGSAGVLAQRQLRQTPTLASKFSVLQQQCADSIEDVSNPGTCLVASSVPSLGKLLPMSSRLYVSPSSGFVGIGTTFPFRPLQVVGPIASSHGTDVLRAVMRPSTNGLHGVIETVANTPVTEPTVTNLITSVSIDPLAGALATIKNGTTFLVTLSTPANNTNAGYVSVRNANAEIAGINGGTGVVFGSSKSFVQPHPSDAAKEIRYVSLEGPEHGVYFRGTARLARGRVVIATPESFRLVARAEGLTVSVTPLGANRGLYVARKGLDGFEVRENEGGSGDTEFDFLVMGERSALPHHVPIAENRHFLPTPGTVIREGELPGSYRELMIRNGTLRADGSVNEASAAALGWQPERNAWSAGRLESAPVAKD
jgi:hypothetical protein